MYIKIKPPCSKGLSLVIMPVLAQKSKHKFAALADEVLQMHTGLSCSIPHQPCPKRPLAPHLGLRVKARAVLNTEMTPTGSNCLIARPHAYRTLLIG